MNFIEFSIFISIIGIIIKLFYDKYINENKVDIVYIIMFVLYLALFIDSIRLSLIAKIGG